MLKQLLAPAMFFVLCLLTPLIGVAQEKIFSGPQPGEGLSSFKVLQVDGPEATTEQEIATKRDGTTLLMFMHTLSEPAIGLMITVEWYASKQEGLSSHFVMLTEDREKAESQAKRWAQRSFFSSSPMTISLDGPEGPGRYGLNRNVDMTVLVAKGNKVVSNFAIRGPNNTDAPGILKAVADALGKPRPSAEKITAELRAERQRRRERNLQENPIFKLAPNTQLGRLMVSMINREGVNQELADGVSEQMKKWAGDDKSRGIALKKYAERVLDGNFELNRYAREVLEEIAGRSGG